MQQEQLLQKLDANPEILSFLNDILSERERQDEQWGGPSADDKHTQMEWMDYIGCQLEKWAKSLFNRGESYMETPDSKMRFIKIAALTLAYYQSTVRKAKAQTDK